MKDELLILELKLKGLYDLRDIRDTREEIKNTKIEIENLKSLLNPTKMENQIKLTQVPVIVHQFIEAGKEVSKRIEDLNLENQVVTIDTIKTLKSLRAELNKEKSVIDKDVKAAFLPVTSVIDEAKASYKENILTQYKNADDILKTKIGFFEIKIKDEKKANIERYFIELCLTEKIDFLKLSQLNLKFDLSTTEKKYKEICNEFVLRVKDDVQLIESGKHQAETMTEYKLTLNASKAITTVRDRKEKERIEKERILQNRTISRESSLRRLDMVYSDLIKSFTFISDDSIFFKQSGVESLSDSDFRKEFISVELKIKAVKDEALRIKEEGLKKAADLANTDAIAQPLKEEVKPDPVTLNTVINAVAPKEIKEVFQAPKEVIKEETFEASFEVSGTMSQLKALGQYMKSQGIEYKNI
jgi:hypothetical protein